MSLLFYHLEIFVSISETADLMPLFLVSDILSILITVKLLSASRPLLHKIMNIFLKLYVWQMLIISVWLNKISTDKLYVRPSHDFA